MNKQNKIIITISAIILFHLIFHGISMNNDIRKLNRDIKRLEYDLDNISEKYNTLVQKNKIIYDSQYNINKVIKGNELFADITVELKSCELNSKDDVTLLYRTNFDSEKSYNYDYDAEKWNEVKVENNKGIYVLNLKLDFSKNYELKISYEQDSKIKYEDLPDLDLYSKAESSFMKDINIYKVKNQKIEFDVQISKFKAIENVKLINAECNVYYDNRKVHYVDIFEKNKIEDRKEPRNQLENNGKDYWFIIEKVDFSDITKFDKSKVVIEIVLKDSINNVYRKSIRVE